MRRGEDLEPARSGVPELGVSLVCTAQAHASLSERLVHRPAGRSWSRFRVLHLIWAAGNVTASDIARSESISRQHASTLLAALEREGLIVRSRDRARDRRLISVRLTESGREQVEAALAAQYGTEAEWFGVLDVDERRTLVGLLERVRLRLRDQADQLPDDAAQAG